MSEIMSVFERRTRQSLAWAVLLSGPLGLGCGSSSNEPEPASTSTSTEGSTTDASATGVLPADTSTGAHDESGSSGGSGGTVPMYGPCEMTGQADCLPGLLCAPIAFGEGSGAIMICTAECHDAAVDCAPAPEGFEPVCNGFLHDVDPDPLCAIGCTDAGDCPAGMACGDGSAFTEPYYCVPD